MRIPDETVAPVHEDVRPDLLEEARRFAALGMEARKALAGTGNPELRIVVSVLHAVGLKLEVGVERRH